MYFKQKDIFRAMNKSFVKKIMNVLRMLRGIAKTYINTRFVRR